MAWACLDRAYFLCDNVALWGDFFGIVDEIWD